MTKISFLITDLRFSGCIGSARDHKPVITLRGDTFIQLTYRKGRDFINALIERTSRQYFKISVLGKECGVPFLHKYTCTTSSEVAQFLCYYLN